MQQLHRIIALLGLAQRAQKPLPLQQEGATSRSKPQVSAPVPAGRRPSLYNGLVDVTNTLAALTAEQEAWAQHSEALWRRAHALADAHAGLDAGDIYHALRCLDLSPAERLRRGLSRGQLRTHAR